MVLGHSRSFPQVPNFLNPFFSQDLYIPHGHCYLWQSNLVGLHVTADAVITLTFYAIPVLLLYFIRQRQDIPFRRTFLLFSAFTIACGTTHLLEIITLWHPFYWLSGLIKAITALVSAYTAIKLIPILPLALALRNPEELEAVNQELEAQIQEREKTEKFLRESEARLQAFVRNTPVILYALDSEGILTFSDGKGLEGLGLKPGEIVGQSAFDLYGDNAIITENLRAVLAGEERAFLCVVSNRVHENRVTPFRDSQGNIQGVIGLASDITERYQAEVELRRSEERYRTLVQNFPNGTVLLFDHDLRYTLAEGQDLAEVGLSKEGMEGKTLWEAIPPQYHATLETVYRRALAGESITKEVSYGDRIYLTHTLPVKNKKGEVYGGMIMTQNITEQKQAEQALQESRNFLQLVIDSIPQGIFWKDRKSRYLGCNQKLAEDAGLSSPGEIVGKTDLDFPWKEYAPLYWSDNEKVMTTGEAKLHIEEPFTNGNGEVRWVQTNKIPLRNGEENVIGVLATYEDITERKQVEVMLRNLNEELEARVTERTVALSTINQRLLKEIREHQDTEKALRYSEERFRFLAESIPQQVWIAEASGQLSYVNQRTLDYFASSEEEVLGWEWRSYIHEEDLPLCQQRWQYSLATGEPYGVEFRLRDENGNYRWHIARALSFIDQEGQVIKWFGTNTDIDDYKRTEAALRDSERKLRLALSAAQMGTWDWEIGKNDDIWSEETEAIFGFAPGTFPGTFTAFVERIYPEDRSRVTDAIANTIKSQSPYELEFRVLCEDGTVHWVASKGSVICDHEQQPIRMSGVVMDITTRKEAEEKIQASLKEKEILLREIHHRVKNNMQVISSLLDLQAKQIDNPEMLSLFKDSQNRIQSMALIHAQLYESQNFSKMDFTSYLKRLVKNLFLSYGFNHETMELQLETEGVSLNLETAIPCGLIVNELVSNALKHAFPNVASGKITITMTSVSQDQFTLTVADNGIGFPENLNFKEVTSSLGLQLVCLLTRQLRGKIDLERTAGTQFVLTLTKIHPG